MTIVTKFRICKKNTIIELFMMMFHCFWGECRTKYFCSRPGLIWQLWFVSWAKQLLTGMIWSVMELWGFRLCSQIGSVVSVHVRAEETSRVKRPKPKNWACEWIDVPQNNWKLNKLVEVARNKSKTQANKSFKFIALDTLLGLDSANREHYRSGLHYSKNADMFKGGVRSICLLPFVNTTFKLGSSSRLSAP